MIDIKDVTDRVTTKEVLEFYGVHFNAKGFALCPFHPERTPSFHYNQKKDTYHCFSCQKHGNMFDFVAETFQYSLPKELPKVLQKIDQDMGLGLDKELPPSEQKKRKQEREEEKRVQKAKEKWDTSLKDNYDRWGNVFRKVFRMFGEQERNNPEFQELMERFEQAFEDFSGNTFRGWPPQDLSRQQKQWMLLAVRGQPRQPDFQSFQESRKSGIQDRYREPPDRQFEMSKAK